MFKNELLSNLIPTMLASSTAGSISRLPCHPLDTIKSRIQVQNTLFSTANFKYSSIVDAFLTIKKTEGLLGLYRGFGITFVGSAPAGCLYFTTYELSKFYLSNLSSLPTSNFALHFASGLIAESFSCVLWVPIDVIKERMQIQEFRKGHISSASPYYKNGVDALQKVIKIDGFRGLYSGYFATLLSFGPFSAFNFMFYEKLKPIMQNYTGKENDLSFESYLICALVAGSAASFITNPLDLIKLRLQVQRSMKNIGDQEYRNMLDGVTKIIKKDGVRGLFRGAGARVAFHAPSTAIGMTLFEQLKKTYTDLLTKGY